MFWKKDSSIIEKERGIMADLMSLIAPKLILKDEDRLFYSYFYSIEL